MGFQSSSLIALKAFRRFKVRDLVVLTRSRWIAWEPAGPNDPGGFPMQVLRSARWLLLALLVSLVPASSYAGVFISVGFAPPVLPVYEQPPCPEPGLMWTPGYWAYGDDGYYWVPGAWVPPPMKARCGPRPIGAGRRPLCLAYRLLGSARWLLRRRQLWLRLHGRRFCGRRVAWA